MTRWAARVAVLLAAGLAGQARAQESPTGKKDEARRERGGSFFSRDEIDFWGTKKESGSARPPERRARRADGPDLYENIFAEPVRMPDGRYGVYVPPRAVLEFLNQPTKEGARAYVAWQEERSRKIAAAVAALDELKREKSGDGTATTKGSVGVDRADASKPSDRVERSAPGKKAKVRLTYFRQPG